MTTFNMKRKCHLMVALLSYFQIFNPAIHRPKWQISPTPKESVRVCHDEPGRVAQSSPQCPNWVVEPASNIHYILTSSPHTETAYDISLDLSSLCRLCMCNVCLFHLLKCGIISKHTSEVMGSFWPSPLYTCCSPSCPSLKRPYN